MASQISKNIEAIIADILECFGIPLNTATSIYKQMLERRKKEALDILFAELRQGKLDNIDQNEIVSIIARYLRDATEGAARNNLRLMAKVISGMINKNKLKAQDFTKYASVLSVLTDEEIYILGILASDGGCYISCKDKLLKSFDEERCTQLLQGLLRTGLIYFYQGVDSEYKEYMGQPESIDEEIKYKEVKTDFWTNYALSSLMEEILQYTPLLINKN